jgi:hypothetical protein
MNCSHYIGEHDEFLTWIFSARETSENPADVSSWMPDIPDIPDTHKKTIYSGDYAKCQFVGKLSSILVLLFRSDGSRIVLHEIQWWKRASISHNKDAMTSDITSMDGLWRLHSPFLKRKGIADATNLFDWRFHRFSDLPDYSFRFYSSDCEISLAGRFRLCQACLRGSKMSNKAHKIARDNFQWFFGDMRLISLSPR